MAATRPQKFRFSRTARENIQRALEKGVRNVADDESAADLFRDLEAIVERRLHPSPDDLPYKDEPPPSELVADVKRIVAAIEALERAVDGARPSTRLRLDQNGTGSIAALVGLPQRNPWVVLCALREQGREILPAVRRVTETWPKRARGALPHPGHQLSREVAFAFVRNGRRVTTSLGGVFGQVVIEVFSALYGEDAPRNAFPMIKTGSDDVKGMSQADAIRIDVRVREAMARYSGVIPQVE